MEQFIQNAACLPAEREKFKALLDLLDALVKEAEEKKLLHEQGLIAHIIRGLPQLAPSERKYFIEHRMEVKRMLMNLSLKPEGEMTGEGSIGKLQWSECYGEMTWYEAVLSVDLANSKRGRELMKWRLPSVMELRTVLHGALPDNKQYWSGEEEIENMAWKVSTKRSCIVEKENMCTVHLLR